MTLLALFSGGWVAGRLAGMPLPIDGTHSLLAWSLSSLVTIYLLTTAVGGILGGATGMLGSARFAAAFGLAAVAPSTAQAAGSQLQKSGVSTGSISSAVQSMLKETGNAKISPDALQAEAHHQGQLAKNSAADSAMNPGQTKQNANDLLFRFFTTPARRRRADRQALIHVVAAQQHVSKALAANTVDGYAQQAQAAQDQAQAALAAAQHKAKEAADAAAAGVAKEAISAFSFFFLAPSQPLQAVS